MFHAKAPSCKAAKVFLLYFFAALREKLCAPIYGSLPTHDLCKMISRNFSKKIFYVPPMLSLIGCYLILLLTIYQSPGINVDVTVPLRIAVHDDFFDRTALKIIKRKKLTHYAIDDTTFNQDLINCIKRDLERMIYTADSSIYIRISFAETTAFQNFKVLASSITSEKKLFFLFFGSELYVIYNNGSKMGRPVRTHGLGVDFL